MREFNLRMIDGKELTVYEWNDVKKPVAVLQLVHGSAEHSMRYQAFAKHMNSLGIVVVADDHRGHGKTAIRDNTMGFFAKHNGWTKIVDDEKMVNDYIRKTYTEVPVFMLGHSMGSFMARTYAIKYSETISGLIVMGTSEKRKATLRFGRDMARIIQFFNNPKTQSKFIWKNSYKPLNKRWRKVENNTGNEWISSDPNIYRTFTEDPLCGGMFSNSAYKDMFIGMLFNTKYKNIRMMRKELPILIVSGEDDPVGKYGKYPNKVNKKFTKLGYDTQIKIYPDARHEILNEHCKTEVEADIVSFINKNLDNL